MSEKFFNSTQGNPLDQAKLQRVMNERIKPILEEEDLAGFILLHKPGLSEVLFQVESSHTSLMIRDGEIIFVTPDPREDLEGFKKAIGGSINFSNHITKVLFNFSNKMSEATDKFCKAMGIRYEEKGGSYINRENRSN